ncbi:MAG: hypothetical protein KDC92_05245, partial [Bacteroidetes bacterium]|nr:hypothetical protein [Bacteroidota bacterium]
MKVYKILLLILMNSNLFAQDWANATKTLDVFIIRKVYFHSPDTGFAVIFTFKNETSGLYETMDGGQNWLPRLTYNTHELFPNNSPVITKNGYVLYNYGQPGDSMIYYHRDSSRYDTFTRQFPSHNNNFSLSKNLVFISSRQNAKTYKIDLVSHKSKKVLDRVLDKKHDPSINTVNDSILYTPGYSTIDDYFMLKSTDYGNNWKRIAYQSPAGLEQFFSHFIAPDTAVGYSRRNPYIYWTYNEGQSWDSIAHGIDFGSHIDDVKFADKDTGYAIVDARRLFKTCNGGKTWKETFYFDCNQNYIGLIDAQNLYCYSTANNQGCISKTRNGGGSFC